MVGVVGFGEGDLAGEAAGPDAALGASQDRPEPAAMASSAGADVQVVADPDDPDGGRGAQVPSGRKAAISSSSAAPIWSSSSAAQSLIASLMPGRE